MSNCVPCNGVFVVILVYLIGKERCLGVSETSVLKIDCHSFRSGCQIRDVRNVMYFYWSYRTWWLQYSRRDFKVKYEFCFLTRKAKPFKKGKKISTIFNQKKINFLLDLSVAFTFPPQV